MRFGAIPRFLIGSLQDQIDCICSKMVITRFCMPAGRIKVILVGEDMGL